ncbi:MAG: DUF1844 domain-containing protein [Candidatus Omnitrophica bacterium]|nr:DUF1844 domain-containing protein [Candidatus Omnitrophota bacterium]
MKNNFYVVVSFFAEIGWQSLGKIANPLTGKIEKNLEITKQIIEILETLKEKTKGNLTDDENRILISTITDLQLNYVEEVSKEKQNKNGTDKE